jgi:hypothetical protein
VFAGIRCARDEARLVGGEEERHVGDLVSRAPARECVALDEARHALEVRGHARGDGARADRVHPDALRPELERHGLRDAHDPVLGCRVGESAGAAHEPRDRRGVDDRALALLEHLDNGLLREDRHGLEVDGDDAVPVVPVLVGESGHVQDARVVAQDVQPAERVDGALQRSLDVGQLRDIGLHGESFATGRLDQLHGLVRGITRVVDGGDLGAFLREAEGHRTTHP